MNRYRIHIALGFIAALHFSGCGNPRATPGYQPLPSSLTALSQIPPEASAEDRQRRRYEASLDGVLCYYAQLQDQNGQPVPDALVFITLRKLGWNNSSRSDVWTKTDSQGRFSVVGGVGTRWYFSAIKRGYTRTGRSGELRGVDTLLATPNAPATVTMWKNTGMKKEELKIYDYYLEPTVPMVVHVPVPTPLVVRLDLIRGALAAEGEEWDVGIELSDNPKPPEHGRYEESLYYIINQGKMTYLADPLPGRSPMVGEDFFFNNVAGVVANDLAFDRCMFLRRAGIHAFQFQSRGGRVHGVIEIDKIRRVATDRGWDLCLRGAINPTGSPALFEKEPTDEEFSTDGYSKGW